MVLNQIEHVGLLPQHVADHLREAIIRGQFKPGDRLKEVEIAKQLGVSTIPVREAFAQLEREGLITAHPRRGKTVRQLDASDLSDLYRLRAMLESSAYGMIQARGGPSPQLLEALAQNLEEETQAIRAQDYQRAVELDLAFHDQIYQEAHSALLLEMWQVLRTRLNLVLFWLWRIYASPTAARAIEDHAGILAALRAGDFAALESLARQVSERVSARVWSILHTAGVT